MIGTCILSDRLQDSIFQRIDVLAEFIDRLGVRLHFLIDAKGLSPSRIKKRASFHVHPAPEVSGVNHQQQLEGLEQGRRPSSAER